jgi:tetratricopeptide (TPR) repeat protein
MNVKDHGHATADDLRRLEELRWTIDRGRYSEDDYLEFALLHFEPLHQEDEAIRLLEVRLERQPANWKVRVWLAYLYQHHLMDRESLRAAQGLLAPLTEQSGAPRAAALILLSSIGRDLEELDLAGQAELLELAIREEPSWVTHRYYVAGCYEDLGRREEAKQQLDAALACVLTAPEVLSAAELEFESFITGRASEGLQSLLQEARRGLGPAG